MDKYTVVIPTLWKSDRTKKLINDLRECEYVGEIIDDEEASKRQDKTYFFRVFHKDGTSHIIDALPHEHSNIMKFVNYQKKLFLFTTMRLRHQNEISFLAIHIFVNRLYNYSS